VVQHLPKTDFMQQNLADFKSSMTRHRGHLYAQVLRRQRSGGSQFEVSLGKESVRPHFNK
jgi:hypothetical protein